MAEEKIAKLALEDGTVFEGISLGSTGTTSGEVVFNTSMTGYQEILTDPSYRGQIVTMTYPEIGNYGVNEEDVESFQPHLAGFVIRNLSDTASNWRSSSSLEDYLKKNSIVGISGIDTRALVKRIRSVGALKGVISTEELGDAKLVQMAKDSESLVGRDLVKEVIPQASSQWSGSLSDWWLLRRDQGGEQSGSQPHVVALDFGMKYNIARHLTDQGGRHLFLAFVSATNCCHWRVVQRLSSSSLVIAVRINLFKKRKRARSRSPRKIMVLRSILIRFRIVLRSPIST